MDQLKETMHSLYTFFATVNLNLTCPTLKFCDFVGKFFCIKLNKISGMSIQYKIIPKNDWFVRFHLNHMSTFHLQNQSLNIILHVSQLNVNFHYQI